MTPAQLTPNPLPDEDDAETPQTPPASDADDAPTPKKEDEAPAKTIRRAKRSYTPPPNKPTSVHLSPTASSRNPKTIGMPKAPIEYAHEIRQCTFSPRVRKRRPFSSVASMAYRWGRSATHGVEGKSDSNTGQGRRRAHEAGPGLDVRGGDGAFGRAAAAAAVRVPRPVARDASRRWREGRVVSMA